MTLCHTCKKSCGELDRRKAAAAGKCAEYEDDSRKRGGLLENDWVW